MKTNLRVSARALLVAILSVQVSVLPTATRMAQAAPVATEAAKPQNESNAVLRLIRGEVAKNPAYYYDDQELTAKQADENKALAFEGIQEVLKKLDDSSFSMESIREDLVRQAIAEEEAQTIELKYVVQRMPSETLDELFNQAIAKGLYDRSLRQDYDAAYTQKEKRDVVLNLVRSDIGRIKSVTLKRLAMLDREGLKHELKLTQSLLNTKGRDTWKIVLVIVIAVAAAGFLSWATVSATKKHWEKKQRRLEEDFRRREEQMGQDYANKEAELQAMYEERARLRNEGYVWSVCSTTTTNKSVSCSYDYSAHAGAEVCVTHCLKNPTTGDAVQQTTECTSAYIPNNCFLKNPYVSGYDDGYDDGYYDGFYTGYDDAYRTAYNDYWYSGYDDGYVRGFNWGYDDGFSDGVSQAAYDDSAANDASEPLVLSMSTNKVDSVKSIKASAKAAASTSSDSSDRRRTGYKSGYREGYAIATQIRIGA